MVKLKIFHIPTTCPGYKFPKNIQEHCDMYKNQKAWETSVFAWHCLSRYVELDKIVFNENGKPYIPSSNVYFSLSHSINEVAIAVSDEPVGVDIQALLPVKMTRGLAKTLLNEKDFKKYETAMYPTIWFTNYWTQHEAYIKLNGDALTMDILRHKPKCKIVSKQIMGKDKRCYCISIATKK